MKLRFDLVEKLTPEMLRESVLANNHRYKAEPLLSKTGTGSLSSASIEDRVNEEKLSMEITRELMKGSATMGRTTRPGAKPGRDAGFSSGVSPLRSLFLLQRQYI